MKIKTNKIIIILLSIWLISPQVVKANTITLVKSYGGTGNDVGRWFTKTDKGEFVIVGNTSSSNGDFTINKGGTDIFISKFDSNGNKMWVKSYGGSGTDYMYHVIHTQDGGFVGLGLSNSSNGDFPSSKGDYDGYIMKFDKDGNKQWFKRFGGSYYDDFSKVIETQDGDFIAVGQSASLNGDITSNKGNFDGIVVKYNNIGTKMWSKNFGGTNDDSISDVIELDNQQLVLVGNSNSNNGDLTSNKGLSDAFIMKIDSVGNKMWMKSYGGIKYDRFMSIKRTQEGDFLIAGGSESSDGDFPLNKGGNDIVVGKFDEFGDKKWLKTYGGNDYDTVAHLSETSRKDIILSGITMSATGDFQPSKGAADALLAKLDYDGDLIWNKTFGGTGNDYSYNIVETSKFEYVMNTSSYSNSGDFGTTKGGADFKFVQFSETPIGQSHDISVGIKSGEFSIDQPLLEATLGTITIDGEIQTMDASLDNVTVKDFRATGDGWNFTVSATPFRATSDSSLTLPTNTLTLEPINSIQWKVGDTNLPTSEMSFPMTIDSGAIKIASSDTGKGTGEYELIFPNQALKLTIDTSTVKIDDSLGTTEFESIITWNLTTGP